MDSSKLNPPIQALALPGSICPRCGTETRFVTDRCDRCGVPFFAAQSTAKPRRRPKLRRDYAPSHEHSSGAGGFLVFLMVVVGAVFVIAKYQMVPILRGMQIQLPLICVIAVAILVVLWAAKFFDSR
jgi:hypothetical protein